MIPERLPVGHAQPLSVVHPYLSPSVMGPSPTVPVVPASLGAG